MQALDAGALKEKAWEHVWSSDSLALDQRHAQADWQRCQIGLFLSGQLEDGGGKETLARWRHALSDKAHGTTASSIVSDQCNKAYYLDGPEGVYTKDSLTGDCGCIQIKAMAISMRRWFPSLAMLKGHSHSSECNKCCRGLADSCGVLGKDQSRLALVWWRWRVVIILPYGCIGVTIGLHALLHRDARPCGAT
ncbi:hypothetical protein B0H66DRAFT_2969 [Apodospora peruviana]|uniref:Uncharacterized protein n=1 Tax=Apodospora peruviana TaxID=516989 RepID=A0AAE0IPQ4_9PEZI|nr:hypothetical protein B0H66DRAFT_2969 [Apodospora peruviana]